VNSRKKVLEQRNLASLREWVTATSDLVQAMNTDEPVESLLTNVAQQACQLLELDMCSVLLANATGTQLLVHGSHGLSATYVERLNSDRPLLVPQALTTTSSPSVKSYLTGEMVVVANVAESTEFSPWRDIANTEGYGSLIASPLKDRDKSIGVLVGYSRAAGDFPEEQQDLMRLLSDFAGTTLLTATLRAASHRMIAELNVANSHLLDQRKNLDRVEIQHEQLMRAVASDIGVDGVISAMARMLDTPVALQGSNGSLIAQERLNVPDQDYAFVANLMNSPSQDVQNFAAHGEASRATEISTNKDEQTIFWVPIHVGEKVVASLWIGPGRPHTRSDQLERQVLERFALVVALELAKQRSAMLARIGVSRDLLSEVLAGASESNRHGLIERAVAMGHDLDKDQFLGVIRAPGDLSSHGWTQQRSLAEIAHLAAQSRELPLLIGGGEGELVVLMTATETADDAPILNFLKAVMAEAHFGSTPTRLAAVTTLTSGGVTGISANYRACVGALRLFPQDANGQVVQLAELGVAALLLTHGSPDDLVHFSDMTLAPILSRGSGKGGDLMLTLQVWLRASCSQRSTATLLNVHQNTVAYRLRAIEDTLQVSLRDPDVQLRLNLALRIYEIHNLESR
jgi:GAF domain-containing protein